MKQRRLKHHADTLAHMACGWQIVGDLHALARLGSGQFEIDALTGSCLLEGRPFRLKLAEALAAWLRGDAEEQGMPLASYKRAQVSLAVNAKVSSDGSSVAFDRRAATVVEASGRVYTARCDKLAEAPYRL